MDASIVEYLLGPAGAAGLTLLLVLTRRLITRQEHERVLQQVEALQITNADLMKANADLRETNRSLTSSGQLVNDVMTTLVTLATQHQPVQGAPVNAPPAIPFHPEN